MICPKCKRLYSDKDVFCVECGTRLVREKKVIDQETPIKRFSNRVKTSKPQNEEIYQNKPKSVNGKYLNDNKLDVIILQNKELINQNKRIIELLEKLVN